MQINYVLEYMVLGFGDAIKVFKPDKLRKQILERLHKAIKNY